MSRHIISETESGLFLWSGELVESSEGNKGAKIKATLHEQKKGVYGGGNFVTTTGFSINFSVVWFARENNYMALTFVLPSATISGISIDDDLEVDKRSYNAVLSSLSGYCL